MSIQAFLKDRCVEVLAIVEGVDQSTGGAVQARQSYLFTEISWHKTFAPCVYQDEDEQKQEVHDDEEADVGWRGETDVGGIVGNSNKSPVIDFR